MFYTQQQFQAVEQQRARETAKAALVSEARRIGSDERRTRARKAPGFTTKVPAFVARALRTQPA